MNLMRRYLAVDPSFTVVAQNSMLSSGPTFQVPVLLGVLNSSRAHAMKCNPFFIFHFLYFFSTGSIIAVLRLLWRFWAVDPAFTLSPGCASVRLLASEYNL